MTIDSEGTTLFTSDYQEHLANRDKALESGVPIPGDDPRRAAVLGSPVAHSRSPQLHLAAYRALGLMTGPMTASSAPVTNCPRG